MKSLSHPVRLKVLCAIIDKEQRVNDLTKLSGVTQSSMSQFLKRMKAEGLLRSRRNGTSVFYEISDTRLLRLLSAVREIYCS